MSSVFSLTAADKERTTKSRPHTPPYTPNRSKIRLQRADSPAPSIHPTETVSPAKAVDARSEVPSTIIVQELAEGHPDYSTDVELVYPDELEEIDSTFDMISDGSDSDDDSDDMITNRMSQLQCEDKAGEARMQRARKERRLSKRQARRVFKRRHSQSLKSDSEVSDTDAMDDQDFANSARRLRRRTKGPDDADLHLKFGLRSSFATISPQPTSPSPSRGHSRRPATGQQARRGKDIAVEDSSSDDLMDTAD